MINKMESAMVGTKRPRTKLKVKHNIETTKLAEQEAPSGRPSMKEQQEKAYIFHPDNLECLFRQTVESQDIILLESKRLTEADKINDLKYCKYHRILGHTLNDCFVFKEKLQELIDKNTVEIDTKMRATTTNVVFANEDIVDPVSIQSNGDDKGS